MSTKIKDRAQELKRQSFVASVEAEAIQLKVGGCAKFELIDLESLQRIKTRFSRHKDKTKQDLRTELSGNTLTIKRYEDES